MNTVSHAPWYPRGMPTRIVAQTGAFCPGGASAFPFDGFYAATSEDGVVEECAPVAKLRCIGWDRASDVMVRPEPAVSTLVPLFRPP